MFTGLVEDVGRLALFRRRAGAATLEVETALPLAAVRVGDSVAVNGVCLTVEAVAAERGRLRFHALEETVGRSNLGGLAVGAEVNVERALCLGDRLGGHLVTGHVDATAAILAIARAGADRVLRVELPPLLAPLAVPKGSVAVDGVSLTLSRLEPAFFEICLIPHTWAATAFRTRRAGDRVNLEGDMLGKFVLRQRQLAETGGGLGWDALAQAGFR